MVDVALDVQFHLQSAVPVLEGEHGAPIEPEVGIEHLVVEEVGDFLAIQFLVGGEEQLHDLLRGFVRQFEFAVGAGVLALIDGGAAQRRVRVFLIEPVVFVEYGHAFRFDGRDGTEQIPHHLEVVVHFTPTAHHIAQAGNIRAIACAAWNRVFFEYVDVIAGHLRIAY